MATQPQTLEKPRAAADERLLTRYRHVRRQTVELGAGLTAEDQCVQSMPDASPTKWHCAHTTWFFETFILRPNVSRYEVFHPKFEFLFNSYYEQVGPQYARPRRGLLTRPSLAEVLDYRRHVDRAMEALAEDTATWDGLADLIDLGLHHEEQHQELILTDLLHMLSCNPLKPAYRPYHPASARDGAALQWLDFEGGIYEIGHTGEDFAYDHEGPRHEVLLRPFRLASRLVTNREWREFMADDGYRRPELWLSDGWALINEEGWRAPLYWEEREDGWRAMTLAGLQPVEDDAPVCHVSFFEADAFASWAGRRLPTEAEWEVAAQSVSVEGNTRGTGLLRPAPASGVSGLQQVFGDVWEYTQSAFRPYPGFKAAAGAIGEYNGKFMSNQMVLRGASCVTPDGHSRVTYRNFFYPHQRWQFMGLRLAEDA